MTNISIGTGTAIATTVIAPEREARGIIKMQIGPARAAQEKYLAPEIMMPTVHVLAPPGSMTAHEQHAIKTGLAPANALATERAKPGLPEPLRKVALGVLMKQGARQRLSGSRAAIRPNAANQDARPVSAGNRNGTPPNVLSANAIPPNVLNANGTLKRLESAKESGIETK
jgi:hypothetical protein